MELPCLGVLDLEIVRVDGYAYQEALLCLVIRYSLGDVVGDAVFDSNL